MAKATAKKRKPAAKAAASGRSDDAAKPTKSVADLVNEIEQRKAPASDVAAGAQSGEQRKAATTVVPDKAEKARMLKELGDKYGTSPEEVEKALSVNDPNKDLVDPNAPVATQPVVKPHKGARAVVKLKADYWMKDDIKDQWPTPHDNRAKAGAVVSLPIADARILIDAGKAERADPLPGEVT